MRAEVVSIHITPEAGGGMQEVPCVEAVAGQGLKGDRYYLKRGTYSDKDDGSRQVTLIEVEALEALPSAVHYPPSAVRRPPSNMNIRLWLFFFAIFLSACAPSFDDCARARVRCVVLLSHPWEEGALRAQAWQAMMNAQKRGDVQAVWRVEVGDARDREREVRWMAERGVDVILTIGTDWDEALQSVAQVYPSRRFVGIDQRPPDSPLPNLTVIVIPYDQLGFLAGALAARVTQTRRVAAICEAESIAEMRQACDGFVRGVSFTARNVFVYRRHREGSRDLLFQDEKWGRETARDLIQQGADVIFAIGGKTAQAALNEAAMDKVLVIGGGEDLYEEFPALRSHWLGAPLPEVQSVLEGLLATSLQNWPTQLPGRVSWAAFRGAGASLPLSLRADLDLLRLQLEAGTLRSGVAP
ncbi:MAG: BMP family ABC transporter substrate-binding protein [Anaerolineales bacterium]